MAWTKRWVDFVCDGCGVMASRVANEVKRAKARGHKLYCTGQCPGNPRAHKAPLSAAARAGISAGAKKPRDRTAAVAGAMRTWQGPRYKLLEPLKQSLGAVTEFPLGNYVFDFAVPAEKLLVEFDEPGHTTQAAVAYDQTKDAQAVGLGWRVVRMAVKAKSTIKLESVTAALDYLRSQSTAGSFVFTAPPVVIPPPPDGLVDQMHWRGPLEHVAVDGRLRCRRKLGEWQPATGTSEKCRRCFPPAVDESAVDSFLEAAVRRGLSRRDDLLQAARADGIAATRADRRLTALVEAGRIRKVGIRSDRRYLAPEGLPAEVIERAVGTTIGGWRLLGRSETGEWMAESIRPETHAAKALFAADGRHFFLTGDRVELGDLVGAKLGLLTVVGPGPVASELSVICECGRKKTKDRTRLVSAESWCCRWQFHQPKSERKRKKTAYDWNRKIVEFNGERRSLIEWARPLNISPATLAWRIFSHKWPLERALFEPNKKPRRPEPRKPVRPRVLPPPAERVIEFNGESKTTAEWAAQLGISIPGLISRLNVHRWPIARALTEPKGVSLTLPRPSRLPPGKGTGRCEASTKAGNQCPAGAAEGAVFCKKHRNGAVICTVRGCSRPHRARGLCESHVRARRRLLAKTEAGVGRPLTEAETAELDRLLRDG